MIMIPFCYYFDIIFMWLVISYSLNRRTSIIRIRAQLIFPFNEKTIVQWKGFINFIKMFINWPFRKKNLTRIPMNLNMTMKKWYLNVKKVNKKRFIVFYDPGNMSLRYSVLKSQWSLKYMWASLLTLWLLTLLHEHWHDSYPFLIWYV